MTMVDMVYRLPIEGEVGLWLKPIGLVQRSASACRDAVFIVWTKWTLAMALRWWQQCKHCPGYYYYFLV